MALRFDTLRTADYSPLVAHFTKGHRMVQEAQIGEDSPLFAHRGASARDRLMSILLNRTIYASPMPFLPSQCQAVCFTECIWEGLTRLANSYSSYGVVFSKRLVFEAGGGPAIYLRGDLLHTYGQQIPQEIHSFIAPFDPEARLNPGTRLDWLHEREWRLPTTFRFEFADIEYVIVESTTDAYAFVHEIGAHLLPESKMIPMEVYGNIRHGWGEDQA